MFQACLRYAKLSYDVWYVRCIKYIFLMIFSTSDGLGLSGCNPIASGRRSVYKEKTFRKKKKKKEKKVPKYSLSLSECWENK